MSFRVVFAAGLFAGSNFVGAALGAQQTPGTATVTGRVTDAQSGASLDAVTVAVQGTQLGAVTGPDGTYRITRVPAGTQRLIARRIGYGASTKTVSTTDGATATVDFTLQASAINLQEVVITGTAGNQTRVAQGAVVATINANDVAAEAPVTSPACT
jgi:hypothetical protein